MIHGNDDYCNDQRTEPVAAQALPADSSSRVSPHSSWFGETIRSYPKSEDDRAHQ